MITIPAVQFGLLNAIHVFTKSTIKDRAAAQAFGLLAPETLPIKNDTPLLIDSCALV